MEDSHQHTDVSVEDAFDIVLKHLYQPKIETCLLSESLNRVLAENIKADRDFPPFNRVAMDGICIRFKEFGKGIRKYKILGIQSAGSEQLSLPEGEYALEVMTGASLPINADTVIRYEDLEITNDEVIISIEDVRHGQNVHTKGLDRKEADVLLKSPKQITAADIGVLATVGISRVPVFSNPKIAVISTGDELVAVHETPLPHQIRKSNVYSLEALMRSLGLEVKHHHIKDDKKSIEDTVSSALESYDVVLFSGAVSKGKFDFLPDVLANLNVVQHFHRVQQRPGKPFWFGTRAETTVFAFPGNPVSTYVCAKRFLIPWVRKSFGLELNNQMAELSADIEFKPKLQYFVPVGLTWNKATLIATAMPGHGSGDLANLSDADGLIELPANETLHPKGGVYPIW